MDRTKLIEMWTIQLSIEKLNEQIKEETEKLKTAIKDMDDEELTLLLESFNRPEMEDYVPDCLVYAIHELEKREEKFLGISEEEAPYF